MEIKVTDTDTTNGNYPQKLVINRTLPMIILTTDPQISVGVAADRCPTYARQMPVSEVIVTDTARSGARIFRTPTDVIRTYRDRTTPRYGNTPIITPRLTSPVLIGGGTTVLPTRNGIQEIISPKGPIGSVEVSNAQMFSTSINGNSSEKGDPTSTFSKVIGQ